MSTRATMSLNGRWTYDVGGRLAPRSPCSSCGLVLLVLLVAATLAACSTPRPHRQQHRPRRVIPAWVKDTVQTLNIFLPDANSDYYLNGFGTKDGARTVISGEVPTARYWSYTAYPIPAGGPVAHVHDSDIVQTNGHYTSRSRRAALASRGRVWPQRRPSPPGWSSCGSTYRSTSTERAPEEFLCRPSRM